MKHLRTLLLLLGLLATACAGAGTRAKANALDKAQYAYSATMRWGDIRGAWAQQDPAWRAAHPLTDLELERYKQLQVTSYQVLDSTGGDPDEAMRTIEIGIANRNTMAARTVTYRETWHYDAAAKTWWVTSGLPDFWNGQ
ncbi:hypothetical protein [Solilutibacter silvestris]|uniref:Lipoprotein n=1 Tax=Solilutibacter silvestris TaxID=1645665 RepID=A0A2K1Q0V5_9GAMM|nr:hypothetical protein [Lysobacter silvestris]PNS08670.1 hypothetical protein Lysil_0299 [Lysobacter silvestris]